MAPPDGIIPDTLGAGSTKRALMRWFGVPVSYFIVSIGIAAAGTVLTFNIFVFVILAFVLLYGGRWAWDGDHNRPRVLWLALLSGAFWAERKAWGGQTYNPLGAPFRAR